MKTWSLRIRIRQGLFFGQLNTSCKCYELVIQQGVNEGNQFDWDEQQQGLVLGGFSYGYFATQVLGGLLAQKYGGKWVYLVACGGSVILGLMVPLAANMDITYLVILRAIQGAFQGAQCPAFFTLTTKWLPESERARSFSLICTGAQFGTIVSLATSGLISYHIGWKYIFYIYGSIGVLWSVLWAFFVFESPANHPRISKVEKCTYM